jgi:hypothetical protein
MSADKRSVHTDALATLGTIIGANEARDAIHLAVEPVIAKTKLQPGMHVGLINGIASPDYQPFLGIVDPFLERHVPAGERFWLVVYPRQITSLRHVWTHPAFDSVPDLPAPVKHVAAVAAVADDWGMVETPPSAPEKPSIDMERAEAETRLSRFAGSIDASLEELIEHAQAHVERGEYWSEDGRFEGQGLPPTFWADYETYTGKKVAADDQYNFFSCSC